MLSANNAHLFQGSDWSATSQGAADAGLRDFTQAELRSCDGVDGRPLYIGINGVVLDVGSHPSGPGFYGPGAGYNCFAGRDATMLFAKSELDASKIDCLGTTMTEAEERSLLGWYDKLSAKYRVVGFITDGVIPKSVASQVAQQQASSA